MGRAITGIDGEPEQIVRAAAPGFRKTVSTSVEHAYLMGGVCSVGARGPRARPFDLAGSHIMAAWRISRYCLQSGLVNA